MLVRGRSVLFESLESRQLLTSEHPVAINFNDEALWDTNFSTAVQQAKTLGVTSVRVWIGFNNYTDRPNAWDIVPPFGAVTAGTADPNDPNIGSPAVAMKQIFALKRAGFSVLLITNSNTGAAPTSPDDVKGWISHLMSATETPTSTQTLADVVDYWEIGNEPDTGGYWAPSAINKTTGLQSYVDNFLIPAAEQLKSGPTPEKVVSAGVSFSPADLKTILDELKAKNALSDIDYAGFHPYGTYDPSNPAAGNQVLDRTTQAKAYAAAVGKSLIATEWNVRGFGNVGANDAKWAQAIDYEYRNVIEPNYAVAYYFALVNNWAVRGGSTSARPGSVLKHNSPISVTPSSPVADLATYLNSPMIPADPFYTTFSKWQLASISGVVTNSGGATPTTTVYIDQNGNGQLDAGEASTTTAANGSYALTYSISTVTPGINVIRIAPPASVVANVGSASADLEALGALTGINFSVSPAVGSPITNGIVSGKLWQDTDADKVLDSGEAVLSGWKVFLDVDGDGVLDATDPQATTDATGAFAIAYDTTNFAAKSAALLVSKTSDYATTTPVATVGLSGGGVTQSGFMIGVYKPPGSISGFLWNDGNGDGLVGPNETRTGARVVFIDKNANGKLDTGEVQTNSDANGNYTFANLTPGTYNVTRVFPTGFHLSNSALAYIPVTVTAGQAVTGINVGTTDVKTPPVVVTTGTVAGKLWNDKDGDKVVDSGEPAVAGWTVFLDVDGDGVLDVTDPQAVTDANGAFTITYDTAKFAATSATLRVNNLAGYVTTTTVSTIALKGGTALSGYTIGTYQPPIVVPPVTTGTVAGKLWNDKDADKVIDSGEPALAGWTVFLDVDGDGVLDATDPQAVTDANGAFTISYDTSKFAATSATLRVNNPADYVTTTTISTVALKGGTALSGYTIGTYQRPIVVPPVTTGTVAGKLWNDKDADKVVDAGEPALAGWTVYLDVDGDGVLDATDPQAVTDANGAFTIAFDTSKFAATSATLRASTPSGYVTTTAIATVALKGNTALSGYTIGAYQPSVTTASISGLLWNDGNANGVFDNNETLTGSRVVYIDANGNNKLDTGEVQTTSDANGNYTFANLAAGTYNVTRVFPTGYRISNSASTFIPVTLTAGQAAKGVNIGTTDKSVPTVPGSTAVVAGKITGADSASQAALYSVPWELYLDANSNGVLDANEATSFMATDGTYKFSALAAGKYTIAMAVNPGWTVTAPVAKTYPITLTAGQSVSGENFVVKKS